MNSLFGVGAIHLAGASFETFHNQPRAGSTEQAPDNGLPYLLTLWLLDLGEVCGSWRSRHSRQSREGQGMG